MSVHETRLGHRPLRLSVPAGEPPAAGWPLLVLLDSDWVWPLEPPVPALDRCAVLLPGHGPAAGARERRTLDFTPPSPEGGLWPDPRHPEWQGGGAPAFLQALLGPLLRWAQGCTALDPARTSLFGHSYGGLFALYALRHQPDAFARIVCASPSLWWRDGFMTRQLDELHDHPPPQPVSLVMLVGSEEKRYAQPAPRDRTLPRTGGVSTLPAIRALAARLQGIPRLNVRLTILPGLSHGPVLHAAARQAIELAGRDAG